MKDNVGNLLVLNNDIISKDSLVMDRFMGKSAYYEVIRIIDQTPLFFEDHIERLQDSLAAKGLKLEYTEKDLNLKIRRIVEANSLKNCNVKITVYPDQDEQTLIMYISKSYYPTDEVVSQGVKLGLMNFERKDPQVKWVNTALREGADEIMNKTGSFEVLLVNNDGRITEGSKSNVFFIKGNEVHTSPVEFILKGITRKYILDVCSNLGYNVIEELISVNELDQIDGLFISGTSIKVLPVSSIDGQMYHSSENAVISQIRVNFDRLIEEYIRKHKI